MRRTPAVHILSLRRTYQDALEFVELRILPGMSHVSLLCGDLIGCAVVNDLSIPHIINWWTSKLYPLGDAADFKVRKVLDLLYFVAQSHPARQRSAHAITIWRQYVIVLRSYDVQIFDWSSQTSPPRFLQTLPFDNFIGNAILCPESRVIPAESHIGITSEFAIENSPPISTLALKYWPDRVLHYCLFYEPLTPNCPFSLSLIQESTSRQPKSGLYLTCSSQRFTWTSDEEIPLNDLPRRRNLDIFCSTLSTPSSHDKGQTSLSLQGIPVICLGRTPQAPRIWGYPCICFDDSLGLMAIGNIFGEIAVYDFTTETSHAIWDISNDPFPAKIESATPVSKVSCWYSILSDDQ